MDLCLQKDGGKSSWVVHVSLSVLLASDTISRMGMTHADSNQSTALKYQHCVHGKLSVLIEKASIMTMYVYMHMHIPFQD